MLSEAIVGAITAGIVLVLAKGGEVIVNIIKAKKEPDQTELAKIEHNQKTEAALDQIQKDLFTLTEDQRKFNLMYLKTSISFIYYEHEKEKKINASELQSVLGLWDVYQSLGGNSGVGDMIEQIKSWERI